MRLAEFDYKVPPELIAQRPSRIRGQDRLLIVNSDSATFKETSFSGIVNFFEKRDLLVLNDTKVMRARVFGKRKTGGRVEIFILDMTKRPVEALVRPSMRLKDGEWIELESGDRAVIRGTQGAKRFVEFSRDPSEIVEKIGHVPLPPYIKRTDDKIDVERYQTVFAKEPGATASPTAGLHFTGELLDRLKDRGVDIAHVTLHVSYGTFAPIKEEIVERHRMHSEFFKVRQDDVRIIKKALQGKARIFACGTTTLRALESCAGAFTDFKGHGFQGFTDLFIYPGYKFRIVDALITNFHLPKSTLILLASAFAGKGLLFKAYDYAIKNRFRFFSYGDAMLIL